MFSGFQSNALQSNAYQIVRNSSILLGGVYGYHRPYQSYKEEEYQRRLAAHKEELERTEKELAEAEKKRLQAMARKKAKRDAEQSALEAKLLAEISRLRILRADLMQLIMEDEAILVILLMAKRRRLRVV